MFRSPDVTVAGAGVFGAWIAYHLTKRGARVRLVDLHGAANARASSGGETRILRMSYGADEIYTRSMIASMPQWKQVCGDLFHRTGVLLTSDARDPYLRATHATLERCGVAHEFTRNIKNHFPQIRLERNTAGIWEPESGVMEARRAVQRVIEECGLTVEIGDAKGVKGPVVFACGPWLPALFPKLLKGRIRPTRQEVCFFGTPAGDATFSRVPAWIAFREGGYSVPGKVVRLKRKD